VCPLSTTHLTSSLVALAMFFAEGSLVYPLIVT
jgi:hypothetical protein